MLKNNPAFEQLRKGLRTPVERGRWPGLAASVYVDGHLQLLEETGYADVEAHVPMTKDSIVRLYSMTKCVIAAAVMQVVEEGLVGLDDNLSDHLPAFSNVRVITEGKDGLPNWQKLVPPVRPIRIRHLLTHTSGISSGLAPGIDGPKKRGARERVWAEIYGPLVRKVDNGEVHDLAEWVNEVAKLPLFDHPGHSYCYGFGYDILGHLVEHKTGKKLTNYLQEHIFGPLGMHSTGFSVSGQQAKLLTTLYRYTKSARFGSNGSKPRLVRMDPQRVSSSSRWAGKCKLPAGGGCMSSLEGGLLSTLSDYAKFLLTVVSGGAHPDTGVRILSPASAAQMLDDQTALLRGPDQPKIPISAHPYDERGLGLSCLGEFQHKGAPTWGHWFDGVPGVRLWGGAASCAFKYDPNGGHPILVIIMTQILPQEDGTAIKELLQGVRRIMADDPTWLATAKA